MISNTQKTLGVHAGCRPLVLSMLLVLMTAPMVAWAADKAPGYEDYKLGHEGYLGDGVIKQGEDQTAELARAAQNPVADMISLPFQNNTNFNFGPREKTQNVLNIQPVIPFDLNEDWLVITRTIVPVISQPPFKSGQDRDFGVGDTVFTAFFIAQEPGSMAGGQLALGRGSGGTAAHPHKRPSGTR